MITKNNIVSVFPVISVDGINNIKVLYYIVFRASFFNPM